MKSLLVAAVTVVSLVLMSACSSTTDPASTKATASTSNQVLTTAHLVSPTEIPLPTPTEIPPSTPTEIPPPTRTEIPLPTPTDLDLSKGPLPAGVPLVMEDFSLVVHDDFSVDHVNNIHYSLVIQNVGTRTRLLSFKCSAFGMRDDLGNEYKAYGADREELYQERQFDLKPDEVLKLRSSNRWHWALRSEIPSFVGPISPQASQIILQLDGLGPFSGVEIAIDL